MLYTDEDIETLEHDFEEHCYKVETSDDEVDILVDGWDVVECSRCGKPMSLIGAKFDANENPCHENCGG